MLEIRSLIAGYGRAPAVFALDLSLRAGEAVVLLGRNGAGKSTTLKACMGLATLLSGDIVFGDKAIAGLQPHEIARLGLGYVPEGRRVFAGLTVAENLEAGRRPPPAGTPAWSAERLYDLFPALGRLRARRAGSLSGGEQQMLALGRALMGHPRALLLDEPLEGLAPLVVDAILRLLGALKREGMALLLAEQNPRLARRVADRVCVLDSGRVRFSGAVDDPAASGPALARYLAV
ncbi:MAG TPA: ABC transporter ATP-binding protein [Burkholderiales bacterium]|nr:ABC transporter ATP-binding protein [Burkholderiales bacterium]